jgi:hypothetical protein
VRVKGAAIQDQWHPCNCYRGEFWKDKQRGVHGLFGKRVNTCRMACFIPHGRYLLCGRPATSKDSKSFVPRLGVCRVSTVSIEARTRRPPRPSRKCGGDHYNSNISHISSARIVRKGHEKTHGASASCHS